MEQKTENFDTMVSRLPFKIFLSIADTGEGLDTNKWMSFFEMLKDKKECHSPYARGILSKSEERIQKIKIEYERGEIKFDSEKLKEVFDRINDKLLPEESDLLEEDLIRFAEKIASISVKKTVFGKFKKHENKNLDDFKSIIRKSNEDIAKKRAK